MSSDLVALRARNALRVQRAEATHRTAELSTSLCARDARTRVSTSVRLVKLARYMLGAWLSVYLVLHISAVPWGYQVAHVFSNTAPHHFVKHPARQRIVSHHSPQCDTSPYLLSRYRRCRADDLSHV